MGGSFGPIEIAQTIDRSPGSVASAKNIGIVAPTAVGALRGQQVIDAGANAGVGFRYTEGAQRIDEFAEQLGIAGGLGSEGVGGQEFKLVRQPLGFRRKRL